MKIFIDLGAYTGDTLRIALEVYKHFDRFYAFEPFSASFEVLKETFVGREEIILYNAAADVTTGQKKLYLQSAHDLCPNAGHSLLSGKSNVREDTFEIVASVDFSTFVTSTFSMSDTIVLKIDIEGMEYDLLAKMIDDESIRYINKIFCEWHATRANIGKRRHKEIIKRLRKCGLDVSGVNRRDEFVRVMKSPDGS